MNQQLADMINYADSGKCKNYFCFELVNVGIKLLLKCGI